MKLLILAMTIIFSSSSFAQEKFFCSLMRSKETVRMVNQHITYDKAKHCAVSCILNLDCSATEVYLFGLGKELADLLGAGEPDENDIKANRIGIDASESGQAKTKSECIDYCLNFDWREL